MKTMKTKIFANTIGGWVLGILIFSHCVANAEPLWQERVHDGVTVSEYAQETPRTMKVFVARVDLTTPGISFTITERLGEGWREPIRTEDKSIDGKYLAETLLESTADFMMRRRASGTNVVLAATMPQSATGSRASRRMNSRLPGSATSIL